MSKPFNGRPLDWLLLLESDPYQHSTAFKVAFGLAIPKDPARKKRDDSPSIDKIAKRIGIPKRSVERYLTELERDGWIEKVRRGNGKSNVYRLTVPDPDPPSTADLKPYPDPPSTADQDGSCDLPSSADQNGAADPPNVADPIEALTRGSRNEGEAAHQAPAQGVADHASLPMNGTMAGRPFPQHSTSRRAWDFSRDAVTPRVTLDGVA